MSEQPMKGQLTIGGQEARPCVVCGGAFVARRVQAMYCSGACRMVAMRERRGAKRRRRYWSSENRATG